MREHYNHERELECCDEHPLATARGTVHEYLLAIARDTVYEHPLTTARGTVYEYLLATARSIV